MAAPIVSTSKQQGTLKRLVKKEESGKVVRKNLLCSEIQEWPRPSDQVQDEILTKFTEKLNSLPNIFKKIVKETKDVEIKAKIRSQLAIGVSQVFRDLEKGKLDCVLVSGQAIPAITVNHVISVCQERGCPILCLDQLAVSLAKSTDSSCFPLAFGFKKMSESDFTEIVSLVKTHAPVSASKSESLGNDSVVLPQNRTVHENLIKLSRPEDEVILAELKRVFTQILVTSTVKHEVKTKGKKKPKKKVNLKTAFDKNYHSQFDFGKRTVCEMVERDKVQLVLVSEEITPVLLGEPLSSSLLYSASEKRCPVAMVTGLTSTLRPLCQGCVSVVGIKKFVSSSGEEKHFQSLVNVCLDAISRVSPGTQPSAVTTVQDRSTVAQNKGGNEETARLDEVEEEYYSDLYVLKKDSKEYSEAMSKLKEEMEKPQRDKFTSDFISLSDSGQRPAVDQTRKPGVVTSAKSVSGSKPAKVQRPSAARQALDPLDAVKPRSSCEESMVQDVGSSNVPNDVAPKKVTDFPNVTCDTQSFTLSRAGDSNLMNKHKLTPPDPSTPTILIQTSVKHSQEVLGSKQLALTNNKVTAGIDYLALSESGAKKSKKNSLKRKSEADGFLSFAYKGANIKTMTSDPNKKRKK